MARPKLSPDHARSPVKVWLSASERTAAKKKAAAVGLPLSDYARRTILRHAVPRGVPSAADVAVWRHFARTADSLLQLLHLAKARSDLPPNLSAVVIVTIELLAKARTTILEKGSGNDPGDQ
ncbi:plasmid mobilization protein [Nitrospirillum amazonense]|uniref:plasmid mobilization protein n=1 Tax=Nitrospirillum amazonense TaxID=28077 RepID=UPI003BAFD494